MMPPDIGLDWRWLLLAAAALLAITVVAALLRVRRLYPYEARAGLLSPAELRFFQALEQALGAQARIHTKVRLADLIQVRSSVSGRGFYRAFSPIACKHVDYVLCDDAHRILCAIELDDRSHHRRERQQRDLFVDAAFKAARIPLLRFPVQARYPLQPLRERLLTVVGRNG